MAITYDYSVAPGVEEARLDAVKTLAIAQLGRINTNLQRGGLWPNTVPLTASMVTIGDPEALQPASVAPILICVVGGGRGDELDIQTTYRTIDRGDTYGMDNRLFTNVLIYLHPDAVPGTVTLSQAETRERVRARICDVMRFGMNHLDYRDLALTSREYNQAPNFDSLRNCRAAMGYKGYFEKSFAGAQTLYGAHIVHYGEVR